MAVSKAVVPLLEGEAAISFMETLSQSRIKPYSAREREETNRKVLSILEEKRRANGVDGRKD